LPRVCPLGDVPQSGAWLEEDECLLAELLQCDGLVTGEPVRSGDSNQYRLPDEQESVQARGQVDVDRGDPRLPWCVLTDPPRQLADFD
jgi:hypothetical protein